MPPRSSASSEQQPAEEPSYLRTYEVAALLHVSPKTVTRWAKEGKLPHSRTLGGHRRYPEDKIRALASSLRFEPSGRQDGSAT